MNAGQAPREAGPATAQLLVSVHPVGVPGQVAIAVVQQAGEPLTRTEQALVLRGAAARLERENIEARGAPAGGRPWPFTDDECAALLAAYEAITRVGNLTRDPARQPADLDFWDEYLDRAHHALGLLHVRLAAR